MDEDKIWDLSDEELEAAFKEAKEESQYENEEEVVEEGQPEDEPQDEIEDDEEVEEEAEEDLEQPEEDSDDDLETDDEAEEATDEDSEDEEGEPDEEPAEEEEQPEEVEEEAEEEVKEVQTYKFKANGQEFEFTDDEIKTQFPKIFGQAMDYTKKTQQLKPWRQTIDALESAQLGHDDVNLMIDVLKGDKEAIAEVLKRTSVDALDLDTENSKYVPKDYGRDDTTLAIKDIIDDISRDKEYTTTERVLSKEWDENSFKSMTENPELIRALHVDVVSGTYDKVQPIAQKLKVIDGGKKPDLEYYKEAGAQYFANLEAQSRREAEAERAKQDNEEKAQKKAEVDRVKATQKKQMANKVVAKKRKAAAPTKKAAGTKKVIDYLDDSDEAFEEWYRDRIENH